MLHARKNPDQNGPVADYAMAVGFFLAALAAFLLLPAQPGLAFVVFFPAVCLAFHFCGVAPGWVTSLLCALAGLYFFERPATPLPAAAPGIPFQGLIGASCFLVAAWTMSLIVRQLRQTARRLRQLAREQETMLDNELVGMIKLKGSEFVWVNKAMVQMFGYEEQEMVGRRSRLLHPDEAAFRAMGAAARQVLLSGQKFRTQTEMVRKDGRRIWVDISGVMFDRDKRESLWMLLDVSEMKKYEAGLEHLASFDMLTGLLRKAVLRQELGQAMARARRRERRLAVLYIDLDGFKPVNDTLGHQAGDEVLKEVGRRLLAEVRITDRVARAGGDEFVILLEDVEEIAAATQVAQKVLAALTEPIGLDAAREVRIGASIGISLFPDDAEEIDRLLQFADQAMYRSKLDGKNRYTLYRDARGMPSLTPWIDSTMVHSIGVDELDLQHRKLMRLANALNDAAMAERSCADLVVLADELIDHLRQHFSTEERLMELHAYADREKHRKVHERLLEDVNRLRSSIAAGSGRTALQGMKDCLINHVHVLDRPMGEHLARET